MGLLTKLKSLLGMDDDRSQVQRSESGVTIEREPDESAEPDAESESAVKGTETDAAESSESEASTESATAEGGTDEDAEASDRDAEAGDRDAGSAAESAADESTAESADAGESAAEESAASETAGDSEQDAETGISTEDLTTAPEGEGVESERGEPAEPAEAVDPSTDAAEPEQTAADEPEPTPETTEGEESDAPDDGPVGEGEPLEDVKGIGAAYAERLRDAGVANVTELSKADAELLAEETGLSAKRIATWIERAEAR